MQVALLTERVYNRIYKSFETENEEWNSGWNGRVPNLPKAWGSLGKNSRMALVASQNFVNSRRKKQKLQSRIPWRYFPVLAFIYLVHSCLKINWWTMKMPEKDTQLQKDISGTLEKLLRLLISYYKAPLLWRKNLELTLLGTKNSQHHKFN